MFKKKEKKFMFSITKNRDTYKMKQLRQVFFFVLDFFPRLQLIYSPRNSQKNKNKTPLNCRSAC